MSETGRQIFALGEVEQAAPDKVIRKHMPLWAFQSLVEMQALYFRRIDKFDKDPWDGHVPSAAWNCHGPELRRWFEGCRQTTFVCCSNMDEHEQRRMWQDYAQGYGICLLTTAGRWLPSFLIHRLLANQLKRIKGDAGHFDINCGLGHWRFFAQPSVEAYEADLSCACRRCGNGSVA